MGDDKNPKRLASLGDIHDPFHLHPSDHPGASLVTKPLNGDNYATWSRSISIALSAKNKTGFIDGSIKKPSEYSDGFAAWKRCNDMVLSWILNSIDPSLTDSVIYTELASTVWADLKDRFSQNNAPRIFQLQREIASSRQESMSITTYYSKMKALWDELGSYGDFHVCTCGASSKLAEKDQVNKPLPHIGKIYAMVLQEERQRDITVTREVMMANTKRPVNNTQTKGRPKLFYTHCKGTNHTVDRCYHLHGFPSRNTKRSNNEGDKKIERPAANNVQAEAPTLTQEQYQQLLSLLNNNCVSNIDAPQANITGLGNEEDDWYGEAA